MASNKEVEIIYNPDGTIGVYVKDANGHKEIRFIDYYEYWCHSWPN